MCNSACTSYHHHPSYTSVRPLSRCRSSAAYLRSSALAIAPAKRSPPRRPALLLANESTSLCTFSPIVATSHLHQVRFFGFEAEFRYCALYFSDSNDASPRATANRAQVNLNRKKKEQSEASGDLHRRLSRHFSFPIAHTHPAILRADTIEFSISNQSHRPNLLKTPDYE